MIHQNDNKEAIYYTIREFAREMRNRPTPAESFFWEKVRGRKYFGLKWNRQFIIECPIISGSVKYYIADFHCHQLKLIVELDGQIHKKQKMKDLIRTEDLTVFGFSVLRFTNQQVLEDWEGVVREIRKLIE
jgi:very-short-patch-repair endonuclease